MKITYVRNRSNVIIDVTSTSYPSYNSHHSNLILNIMGTSYWDCFRPFSLQILINHSPLETQLHNRVNPVLIRIYLKSAVERTPGNYCTSRKKNKLHEYSTIHQAARIQFWEIKIHYQVFLRETSESNGYFFCCQAVIDEQQLYYTYGA